MMKMNAGSVLFAIIQICILKELNSSLVMQEENTAIPVWLIDIVPQSTENGTNSTTWVDLATYGHSSLTLSQKIPSSHQEVFTVTVNNDRYLTDNFRVFSPDGNPLLALNSQIYGMATGFLKCHQKKCWAVTSTYWARTGVENLWVQPIDIKDDTFAARGKPSTKTDRRYMTVTDDPGEMQFYATNTVRLFKYSLPDGHIKESLEVGDLSDVPDFTIMLNSVNGVLVSFSGNKKVALFDKHNLAVTTFQFTSDCGYASILDTQTSKTLYSLVTVPRFSTAIHKSRLLDPKGNLISVEAKTNQFLFRLGNLAQISKTNYIMVVPEHNHIDTGSTLRGYVLFISESTFQVTQFQTPQRWSVQHMIQTLSNPSLPDHGMRLYFAFMDGYSQNLHFYYFLVDECLAADAQSEKCSHCPNGYWRLSARYPAPRRCLKPAQFPPAAGIEQSSGLIQPCRVANCQDCSTDHSTCVSCDKSAGFYLLADGSAPKCVRPEEFPSGFGLDLQQQNLVKCADSKCLACRLSWDKCTECDKLSGWYLRDHLCIDLQKMPAGKGPQHDTGRVVECAAPGCLSCATDFQQCQRCDPFLGWFLDKKQQRCKQIQDFSPNEGKDPATFSVTNCIEPGCSDCKDDYRFCKSDSGSAGSLKIKKVKYLTKRKLAEVVFDSPVLLNFEGSFWDEFSVTIIHLKNNSQIRCQMPQSLAAEASCSETITPTGFKIQVSTDFEVVLGEIRINSKSFTSGGKNSPIYSKYTSEQFREFPIVVGGFSTSDSKFFSIVSSAVSFVSLSRPVLSLALGVVSLDAMIYFDRTFVHLYYLALLEGAHLVLPQQVFETIMSPSNILPEKWLPTREQLSLFGPLSTCIPSRTLANQDFECSMLANIRFDTVGLLLVFCISALLTYASNRIREIPLAHFGTEYLRRTGTEECPNEHNNHTLELSRSSWASLSMRRKSEASTEEKEISTDHQPRGSLSAGLSRSVSKMVVFCGDHFGMNFFFAKLEAFQLQIFLSIMLNIWNAKYSLLEQYSLIAAIIFTLYYIFQGYFTYQFASYIWKEVQTQKLATNELQGKGHDMIGEGLGEQQVLKDMFPQLLAGSSPKFLGFLYSGAKVPETFLNMCHPQVYMARSLLLSICLVMLASVPFIQISAALIVEIAYLVFIIKWSESRDKTRRKVDARNHFILCVYLGCTFLATSNQFGESESQGLFGTLAALAVLMHPTLATWRTILATQASIKNNGINDRRGTGKNLTQGSVNPNKKTELPDIEIANVSDEQTRDEILRASGRA